jgi:hypothetical protein
MATDRACPNLWEIWNELRNLQRQHVNRFTKSRRDQRRQALLENLQEHVVQHLNCPQMLVREPLLWPVGVGPGKIDGTLLVAAALHGDDEVLRALLFVEPPGFRDMCINQMSIAHERDRDYGIAGAPFPFRSPLQHAIADAESVECVRLLRSAGALTESHHMTREIAYCCELCFGMFIPGPEQTTHQLVMAMKEEAARDRVYSLLFEIPSLFELCVKHLTSRHRAVLRQQQASQQADWLEQLSNLPEAFHEFFEPELITYTTQRQQEVTLQLLRESLISAEEAVSRGVELFTLDQLRSRQAPVSHPDQFERYLTPRQFQQAFNMTHDDFDRLPAWKQRLLRQQSVRPTPRKS